MKLKLFSLAFSLTAFILVSIFLMSAASAVPYESYVYNYWGEAVPAPQAYLPYREIGRRELELDNLREPRDFYIDENLLYLLDSGNNRIVCIDIDKDWKVVNIIDSFENKGRTDTFNNPRGIYIDPGGNIFVADSQNARIVELDPEGNLLRIIGRPQADIEGVIPEGFTYRPIKVGVDRARRIYVLGEGVYDGIMEFDVDGNFSGFIGAPRVSPSVSDYVWRMIATEEQRRRMALYLPVEHSNLDIDERGFIYATVRGGAIGDDEKIRRLNPSGDDVLRRMGFFPPVGDFGSGIRDADFLADANVQMGTPSSRFVDITAREFGMYSALDGESGRVFTYNADGHLLYVFGGQGGQKGLVRNPEAIGTIGDKIVVLDRRAANLTIYRPTQYAQSIHAAIHYYNTGRYDRATAMWNQVLSLNANYDLAYTGIGRALLRQDDFYEAMRFFRLGQNRPAYSEAFSLHRREILGQHFGIIIFVLFLLALSLLLAKRFLPRIVHKKQKGYAEAINAAAEGPVGAQQDRIWRTLGSLAYSRHIIFHPFDGFWDLKHEKRGNVPAGSLILILLTLTYIFMRQYTGFIFNPWDLTRLNIYLEAASILAPFGLWTMVNWAFTTLMEGKGTPREIFISSAFAMTPFIVVNIPMTVLSNFITMDEGAFYYFFLVLGVIWSMSLLFFATMVTHDYSLTKTLLTIGLIIIGMLAVLFLSMMFFTVINQILMFFRQIYTEMILRV